MAAASGHCAIDVATSERIVVFVGKLYDMNDFAEQIYITYQYKKIERDNKKKRALPRAELTPSRS